MSPTEGAPGNGNFEPKLVGGDLSNVRPGVDVVKSFGERAVERGALRREGKGRAAELFARLGESLQRRVDFARGMPAEIGDSLVRSCNALGDSFERLDKKYVDFYMGMRAAQGGVRFYDAENEEVTRPIHEAWKKAVLGSANRWEQAQVLCGRLIGELPRRIRQYGAFWQDVDAIFAQGREVLAAKSKERQERNLLRNLENDLSLKVAERSRLLNARVLHAEKILTALDAEIEQLRTHIQVLKDKKQSALNLRDMFGSPVNDNDNDDNSIYAAAKAA